MATVANIKFKYLVRVYDDIGHGDYETDGDELWNITTGVKIQLTLPEAIERLHVVKLMVSDNGTRTVLHEIKSVNELKNGIS